MTRIFSVICRLTYSKQHRQKMAPTSKLTAVLLVFFICLGWTLGKSIAQGEKVIFPSQFDMVDDDGTVDTALMNYLFARQMVNRLRNNLDVNDLQRKRTYWKQCAFNAVSCFGKK